MAGAGAGGAVRPVRVADPRRLRLVLGDAGGRAAGGLRALRQPGPGGDGARRAVDGAEGRVRVPPARLVHPLRGHVRADRELPGVLRAGRGDRAVRVAGLSFLAGQQTFYSRTDEELWRLAGRARELGVTAPLLHGSPDECGPSSRRCRAALAGSRSSTRSSPSTGSGSRRPAGSTRRRGSRTRRRRCTRSARSCPSRPGSTSTPRAGRRSPNATSRSRRRGGRSTARTWRGSTRRWPPTRPPTSPGGTRSTTT